MGPPKGYSTFHPKETTTFNWSAVANAANYRLEYSTNSNFPLTPATGWFDNIPNPTYTFAMGDCCPGNYFARVFAVTATSYVTARFGYSGSAKSQIPRTQVTITWGSNLRFQNNGGRQDLISSPYQIRSCNTSETNKI